MIFMFFETVTCKFIKEKAGRNKQKTTKCHTTQTRIESRSQYPNSIYLNQKPKDLKYMGQAQIDCQLFVLL